MKNAKELMLEYTAFSFREPKKAAEMFAEDGAFELPYLSTFGLPTEYKGRDAIAAFFQSILDIYPGFQFENTKVLIDTPDQVFAEFEATAVSSKTGRTVHQLFFSRLVAENGKIKLIREVDLSPILRQTVKTQISLKPLNGGLSHGIVSKAVH